MASSSSSIGGEKRIIKLLLQQGQKSAKQLQILLHNNRDQPTDTEAADGLVDQILTSFTERIQRMDQLPNKSQIRSVGTSSSSNLIMDKNKRRKCSETRTKVSPTMEDGQAWRKYGQKVILNSNFPRSYFRCKATKQVKIVEENPQLYQITYIGFHTCCTSHTPAPTLFASSSSDVKEEEEEEHNKEQDTMSDLTDNLNSSSSFQQLHMDLHHISHIASAFDDVTSQFDHPDFKVNDFFFFDHPHL